ncbi:haloacid dehalogenase type II [Cognatishimia maritima]|uniref:(S)-2-haloacid dehalogenase n=1 Tax=Cognatishimia maritima TaxID=870908 RepID=A0A1M5KD28_9RHOB|nr:haloacid dehalogenase type II [Cognatishimia maritima]SHG50692.1 2-haloacid dehalogenase [Cognatishimia maritima]
MPITTCVFDAYGTLFDVAAAARIAAGEPGMEALQERWPQIARDWRLKQLQYSWLRAITGDHTEFWQVTQDGLDWALEAAGLTDESIRARLLQLYWELPAYPEVPQMLTTLKDKGLQTAILSNGDPKMLGAAIQSAQLGPLLDDSLSVEEVGIFKPDARVYDIVLKRFSCQPDEVLFVSSNGWDVAGAAGFGFVTTWVNRAQEPVDRLPHRPHHLLSDLSDIPALTET